MLAFVGFVMCAQISGLNPLAALSQHIADPLNTTIFSKAVIIPGQVVQPPCMIPDTVQFQGVTIPAGCFLHAVSGGRGGRSGGRGALSVPCVGFAWFRSVCLPAAVLTLMPRLPPPSRSCSCGLEAPTRQPCGRHRRSDTLRPCCCCRCGGPRGLRSCGGPLALTRFLACLELAAAICGPHLSSGP
jgi:hypothetical protein